MNTPLIFRPRHAAACALALSCAASSYAEAQELTPDALPGGEAGAVALDDVYADALVYGEPYEVAQYGGGFQGGYQGGYAPPPPGYYPPPGAPGKTKKDSTGLEVAYLYGTAIAYGVGLGIWLDAEFEIEDPGLMLIMPGVLGLAAPVGVYVLDHPPMPEGMPSAIATGLAIGAGEGLGFASYQWVTADEPDELSFKWLARAEVIGATVGGAAGFVGYYFLKPSPKTNMLLTSSVVWGSVLGSEFGGGASNGDWGETNDSVSLGGLIGFNVALAGAAGLSTVWTPSWDQLGWMWGGLAIGTAVSLPVYIFYAGSDYDARRGLIFQGVAGTLGLAAGAFIGRPDKKGAIVENDDFDHDQFARIVGGSLMPVPGGAGATLVGQLW